MLSTSLVSGKPPEHLVHADFVTISQLGLSDQLGKLSKVGPLSQSVGTAISAGRRRVVTITTTSRRGVSHTHAH